MHIYVFSQSSIYCLLNQLMIALSFVLTYPCSKEKETEIGKSKFCLFIYIIDKFCFVIPFSCFRVLTEHSQNRKSQTFAILMWETSDRDNDT